MMDLMSETETSTDSFVTRIVRWLFGLDYERNVGGIERLLRYVVGSGFVVIGIGIGVISPVESTVVNVLLMLAFVLWGVYSIYQARVRYCPVNYAVGRNSAS